MAEIPSAKVESSSGPVPLPGRPWYVSATLALLAVGLVLASAWLFTRAKSAYPFFGTAYDAAPLAKTFSGADDNGRPYTFQPDGKTTTAMFFGFTHCPNICPLSLSYLTKVRLALTPEQQKNFQILFVSVDPERDTPQRMHDYVTYFGEGIGVTVPEPQLSEVARAYAVGYEKVDIKSKDNYQINHTTASYLIDSGGHLRVLWDYTQMPQVERVKQDVQYVMEHPVR